MTPDILALLRPVIVSVTKAEIIDQRRPKDRGETEREVASDVVVVSTEARRSGRVLRERVRHEREQLGAVEEQKAREGLMLRRQLVIKANSELV